MRTPSNKELDNYVQCVTNAAVTGGFAGVFVSTSGLYLAKRRFPGYINQGMFAKTLFYISPIIAFGATNMEIASRNFERQSMDPKFDKKRELKKQQRGQLPLTKRLQSTAIENKYRIIFGTWTASLIGAFF